jgi:hypothetical protein
MLAVSNEKIKLSLKQDSTESSKFSPLNTGLIAAGIHNAERKTEREREREKPFHLFCGVAPFYQ